MLTTFLIFNLFLTPGETVTGNHYQVAFGGKGANQAVAAGRSGANIAFIACTGDDSIGESVRQQLATDNIDITPVSVIKGESTGVALIFVNGEGENVIGIHAGLMLPFPRRWWKRNVSVLPTRQHY